MATHTTANPFALDPEIVAMCDSIGQISYCAAAMGQTFEVALAAFVAVLRSQRIATGYQPAAQRRAVRGRTYRDGLRTPKRRETLADRKRREAAAWGFGL
jgi:hypothetical protein